MTATFRRIANAFLTWWPALALLSCADPIREQAIAALGPEESGVRPGPLHRPGQPCVLCHDADGTAPPFTLGGTVYVDAASNLPVGDVAVTIIDATRAVFTSVTNCAGNFFVTPAEFAPAYPIWVSMRGGDVHRSMESPAYREGSCAGCHADPRSKSSVGHVYLIDDPAVEMRPPNRCN